MSVNLLLENLFIKVASRNPSTKLSCTCMHTVLFTIGGRCHNFFFFSFFFVATFCVCHDKTHLLSQQKYASRDKDFVEKKLCLLQQPKNCHDKSFVMTNICCDKHNFVVTKLLSRQACFCCDKYVFVITKHVFCRDKSMLVETKHLWRQTHVCCNKYLS